MSRDTYDDHDQMFDREADIDPKTAEELMRMLQTKTSDVSESLALLAVAAHALMSLSGVWVFESGDMGCKGIRFTRLTLEEIQQSGQEADCSLPSRLH